MSSGVRSESERKKYKLKVGNEDELNEEERMRSEGKTKKV